MNAPETISLRLSPCRLMVSYSTWLVSWMDSTMVWSMISILGLAIALSTTTPWALNSLRRCRGYTLLANRVRNTAYSTAESPPPTTEASMSWKKAQSQIAQKVTLLDEHCRLGSVDVGALGQPQTLSGNCRQV